MTKFLDHVKATYFFFFLHDMFYMICITFAMDINKVVFSKKKNVKRGKMGGSEAAFLFAASL